MRDHVDNTHNPDWGWGLLAGIGAVYVASICLLLVLLWDIRRDIFIVTDRLPAAMLSFERAIGYGGLIHNFKNNVLRPEEDQYAREALENYANAIRALDEVKRIAADKQVEIRTDKIRERLDLYRAMIDEVAAAQRRDLPIEETDARVRMPDNQALVDLRAAHDEIAAALTREIQARRTQITVMIGVISLLMLLLPAGAVTMLWLKRREERKYVARIETLNAGLDHQNDRLSAANHALSVTNADLNEFAHAASHDLRTPLRGISHEAEYLVQEFGETMEQEAKDRLVHIQALCRRLDNVMTLLLRYARLVPPTRVDMVDPLGVIVEIEDGMAPQLVASAGSITIETELPPVACRRFDLGMVFQKLIENALKFNRSAEKEIAVGFLSEVDIAGEVLRDMFYVRDNGIGISDEYHEDIFRMFKRLHHDDAYGPGAGAGLSFVKKVIGNYGGAVRITSEPGTGTTVYFSFGRPSGTKPAGEAAARPVPLRSVSA